LFIQAEELQKLRPATEKTPKPCHKWAMQFISTQPTLCVRKAHRLHKYRAAAGTRENIRPFFDVLKEQYEKKKYMKNLIFNMDETNLLVKNFYPEQVILPSGSCEIPGILESSLISKCTVCLVICADSSHLSPSLILPSSIPKPMFEDFRSPSLRIFQTESGYTTMKIFQEYMEDVILPQILERKRFFSKGESLPPALLFLDGHCSRRNKALWEKYSLSGVDVCILPAHTSHFLQPLDLGINGYLKRLLQSAPPIPMKSRMAKEMIEWIEQIETIIETSMSRDGVKNAFEESGLVPLIGEMVLRKLPETGPKLERRREMHPDLGGKIVTEKFFLDSWDDLKQKDEESERILGEQEEHGGDEKEGKTKKGLRKEEGWKRGQTNKFASKKKSRMDGKQNSLSTESRRKRARFSSPSDSDSEFRSDENEEIDQLENWTEDVPRRRLGKEYRKIRFPEGTELVICSSPKVGEEEGVQEEKSLLEKLAEYETEKVRKKQLLEILKDKTKEILEKNIKKKMKLYRFAEKTRREEARTVAAGVKEGNKLEKKRMKSHEKVRTVAQMKEKIKEEGVTQKIELGKTLQKQKRSHWLKEDIKEEISSEDSDVIILEVRKRGEQERRIETSMEEEGGEGEGE
jgi:hypothetical protein